MKTKPPISEEIRELLRHRAGRDQAVTAEGICAELGWSPGRAREVRRIIACHEHYWDVVIVSCPSGYYCAESFEDLQERHDWLHKFAEAATAKLAGFKARCLALGFHFGEQTPDSGPKETK